MAMTLAQYAEWLSEQDIPWPTPPAPDPLRAKPSLPRLDDVRAVMWNVYGTLLNIFQGELLFEHPQDFIMTVALDKTIHQFKMWNSMSRKPGQPSEYMREIYNRVLLEHRSVGSGGERHPEISSDKIWDGIIKKLFQKEYTFDAGFYGSLNEYAKKIAYFFHASMQGTAAYPGAAEAIRAVSAAGLNQGCIADGQHFTLVQLQRGVDEQESGLDLDELFGTGLAVISYDVRARKPSETIFRAALKALSQQGIEPAETLYVGSHLTRDIAPAKKLGMRTALFAGDRHSLSATAEQLKDANLRPDALLTELPQIAQVIG